MQITKHRTLARSAAAVFKYLGDLSNMERWDPGVLSSSPSRRGRSGEYDVVATLAGVPFPMRYRVQHQVRDTELELFGSYCGGHVVDRITICPLADDACRVSWSLQVFPSFPLERLLPLDVGEQSLHRLGERALDGLARAAARGFERPAPQTSAARAWWGALACLSEFAVAPAYGSVGYGLRSRAWPKEETPELAGKTIVVTGANSGLGFESARQLAARGAEVIMACRNEERGRSAQSRLEREEHSGGLLLRSLDLADLRSVKRFVQELAESHGEAGVDAVIHNAGMLLTEPQRSVQGYEATYAVHVLGPFYLNQLLKEAGLLRVGTRLVQVSSGGMYTQRLDLRTLAHGPSRFDGVRAYAQAKRAQVLLSEHWHSELANDGVAVSVMHPGWADTPGVQHSLPRFRAITKRLLRNEAQGADTIVWLASSPEAASPRGQLYFDRKPRRTHIPFAPTKAAPASLESLVAMCREHIRVFERT